MKQLLVSLLLSALIVQNLGAIIQKYSDKEIHELFNNEMTKVLELTKPVLKAAHDLRQQVTVYKNEHQKAVLGPSPADFNVNSTACNNLAADLVTAGELAENATLDVYHMVLNVSNTLAGLTDCIGWNPIDTAKCYVNDVTNVINTVRSIKPTIVSYMNQIKFTSTKLKPEFMECIGDGPTSPPATILKETRRL